MKIPPGKRLSLKKDIGIDTAIVLFFLALECGRGVQAFSIDGLLMGSTILMVLITPYFLPSHQEKPTFYGWLIARGSVAVAGLIGGMAFRGSIGGVLPEA